MQPGDPLPAAEANRALPASSAAPAPADARRRHPALELLRAAAIVAASTAVALVLRRLWAIPDVEMLFLVAVMVVAATSGRAAAYLASTLSVASYDFFFVPPHLTLDVADARYVLTFAMMFGLSAVISSLTLRLRAARAAAEARERHTATLLALTRDLGRADDEASVAAICVGAAAALLGPAEVVYLAARPDDALAPIAAAPADAALTPAELAVARWARARGLPAGAGTDVLTDETVWCAPLRTWGEAMAVLAVRRAGGPPGAAQRTFLEALARQTALVLDRVRLAGEARRSAVRVEREELRSGLLSAVSHDLRTPLAAITGAGTMLRDEAALDPALRRELVETVCDEAERLERLVSNLLEMTRLESGAVEPRREWVPLDEVVGAALTRLDRRLAGREVTTALPEDLPLLSIDPVLIEQLLVNLLENALKYTPPGSGIELRAARDGEALTLEVADRGPGIPPGDEERIFERFHRGPHAAGIRGVGLGLPICRAIAVAHGGHLAAANRPGGGAAFRLTLPLAAGAPAAVPAARPQGDPP